MSCGLPSIRSCIYDPLNVSYPRTSVIYGELADSLGIAARKTALIIAPFKLLNSPLDIKSALRVYITGKQAWFHPPLQVFHKSPLAKYVLYILRYIFHILLK